MSDLMVLPSSKREDDSSSSSTSESKRLRRRREDDSSSSPTETKLWSLDHLNDDLLIEILTRLPTAKSAFALKMVCRRWCSLISTNLCFITKFITHHMNQKSSYDPYYAAYQNPPTDFITLDSNPQPFFIPHADYKTYDHESPPPLGYTLEFLPEERKSVSLLASSNDLLFCKAKQNDSVDVNYYICNPFTMQWFLLPPPPVRQYNSQHYGLVCAPNHQTWQQQQQAPYDFRFRAVHITWTGWRGRRKHSFHVDVYCSETRQWTESILLGAQYLPKRNIVAHDGRLHWNNGSNIAVYDPFNDDAQTIVVKEYEGITSRYEMFCTGSYCVGVSQGSLLFLLLASYSNPSVSDHLGVWELEDYESKKLSLKHKIYFRNVQNSLVQRLVRHRLLQAQALGFHPNDKDVVYIFLKKNIIACRIQGGELQVVDETQVVDEMQGGEIENSSKFFNINHRVFTTALPWWPTQISTLPHEKCPSNPLEQ